MVDTFTLIPFNVWTENTITAAVNTISELDTKTIEEITIPINLVWENLMVPLVKYKSLTQAYGSYFFIGKYHKDENIRNLCINAEILVNDLYCNNRANFLVVLTKYRDSFVDINTLDKNKRLLLFDYIDQYKYVEGSNITKLHNEFNENINRTKYKIGITDNEIQSYYDQDTRKQLYNSYYDAFVHNLKLFEKVIEKRNEIAIKYKFNNYADYINRDLIGSDTQRTIEKLNNIASKFDKSYNDFFDYIGKDYINAWDFKYYLKSYNNLNISNIYFDIDKIKNCIKKIAAEYFKLTFVAIDTTNKWDSTVFVYQVLHNNNIIGYIYYDIFKRVGKNMMEFCYRMIDNIDTQKTVLLINCNINPISYVSISEVMTLFHETGHAIHLLFRFYVDENRKYGCRDDMIEIPAHFMEYFLFEKEILDTITVKKINNDDVASLRKMYMNDIWLKYQITNYIFELKINMKTNTGPKFLKILDELRGNILRIKNSKDEYLACQSYCSSRNGRHYVYFFAKQYALKIFKKMYNNDKKNDIMEEYINMILKASVYEKTDVILKKFLGDDYDEFQSMATYYT